MLIKILIAVLVGAIIGLEREISKKPAGLRTNILVVLGSTLFAALSLSVSKDFPPETAGRIASSIVTGLGFLGAGVILQSKGHVHGLTTAATIWTGGAIGAFIGFGRYLDAMLAAGIAVFILFGLRHLESLMRHKFDEHPHE